MATRLDARLAFFCACGRCPFTSSCRAVCLFIRLAFSRSVCLRACLSPGLSVYMCLPQSHRPFMSHFSVFADASFPLFDSWLMRFSFCLYVYVSLAVCLHVFLSFSVYTCLSVAVCLPVSLCLCVYPSLCLNSCRLCLSVFTCISLSLLVCTYGFLFKYVSFFLCPVLRVSLGLSVITFVFLCLFKSLSLSLST